MLLHAVVDERVDRAFRVFLHESRVIHDVVGIRPLVGADALFHFRVVAKDRRFLRFRLKMAPDGQWKQEFLRELRAAKMPVR